MSISLLVLFLSTFKSVGFVASLLGATVPGNKKTIREMSNRVRFRLFSFVSCVQSSRRNERGRYDVTFEQLLTFIFIFFFLCFFYISKLRHQLILQKLSLLLLICTCFTSNLSPYYYLLFSITIYYIPCICFPCQKYSIQPTNILQ